MTVAAASEAASNSTTLWTWGAVAAFAAVVGVVLVVLYRRRDARTRRLTPGYDAATQALVLLNRLSTRISVTGVTDELTELTDIVSLLTTAAGRSPKVPFGAAATAIGDYVDAALAANYTATVTADLSVLDSHLTLTVIQGVKLEAARNKIICLQRVIEKQTSK